MTGIIRLEWFRPKGYRVVEQWGPYNSSDLDEDFRQGHRSHLTRVFDAAKREGEVHESVRGPELYWPREFAPALYAGPEAWLVPRTPPTKTHPTNYVIDGTDHRVYLDLANAANGPPTVEHALAFLTKWGSPHPHPSGEIAVRIFYDIAGYMKEAVALAQGDPAAASKYMDQQEWAPRVGLQLTPRFGRLQGDTAPRLYLDTVDLLGFCQAELMQALAGGTEIRPCGNCGTLLALGKVGHPPRYCSDRCRIAMHRKGKREREKKRARRSKAL